MLYRDIIEIETRRGMSFVDITDRVNAVVRTCKIEEGLCSIFLKATTAGLMISENERLLFEDFMRLFEKTAPENKLYSHESNAFSHIRANMLRTEFTVPVSRNRLSLGTWQRILLWEFDIEPRKREIIVTVNVG